MSAKHEIEQRTRKIRDLTAKAHRLAESDHRTERSELGKIIAGINDEIHILLREIEEVAMTLG